jgi:type III pantothenate kinase
MRTALSNALFRRKDGLLPKNMIYICLDIGNTRTKLGIFEEGVETIYLISDHFPFSELNQYMHSWPNAVLMVSSTQLLAQEVSDFLQKADRLIWLSHQVNLPFKNAYGSPQTLGLDRIALAAAAVSMYPGKDVLVIDAGTCITLDFVDRQGVYHGGSIHPGISMRLKAMHNYTGKLPLVEAMAPSELLGFDTTSCLQVGAVGGAVAEMEAFIAMYRTRFPNCKVLLTGGDSELFFSKLKNEIFAHPNLVLTGLLEIAKNNV